MQRRREDERMRGEEGGVEGESVEYGNKGIRESEM